MGSIFILCKFLDEELLFEKSSTWVSYSLEVRPVFLTGSSRTEIIVTGQVLVKTLSTKFFRNRSVLSEMKLADSLHIIVHLLRFAQRTWNYYVML